MIMSAIARNRMKNWEIIADNLSKADWSWAASQRLIPTGEQSGLQTHTHRDAKRFVVHSDDKLTAFVELEAAIRACGEFRLLRNLG